MKKAVLILSITAFFILEAKAQLQNNYPRVRLAYKEKTKILQDMLKEKGISNFNIDILLVSLKKEKDLLVYVKKKSENTFQHLITYDFCVLSGDLGPKRQSGDLQVPEGLYKISYFNPSSSFHLSMKVDYPNTSDRILGVKGNLGGDIFIHGACCSIGCIPITDDKIKELYVLALKAKANGQKNIPVYMFPGKMDDTNFAILKAKGKNNKKLITFWENLKPAYDKFMKTKQKLSYTINRQNGKYVIK